MKRYQISLLMMFAALVFVGILEWTESRSSKSIQTSQVQPLAEPVATTQPIEVQASDQVLQNAFNNRRSNLQVQGKATVYRILTDDLKGSRHQRFLLRTGTGLSLLIAHNIDLAPRIPDIKVGDTVEFYGEYEYNGKGGVVHWTHHDPRGRHAVGWLHHNGKTYQ
ncbi:MAG: DUF3465 domain-containing protein [Candidatus Hydrogenedentota bacterium]